MLVKFCAHCAEEIFRFDSGRHWFRKDAGPETCDRSPDGRHTPASVVSVTDYEQVRANVKVAALRGQVTIELPAPHAYGTSPDGQRTWASVTLSIEDADLLANAVAEAQLVAMEQRQAASRPRFHQALGVCWCGGQHTMMDAIALNEAADGLRLVAEQAGQ